MKNEMKNETTNETEASMRLIYTTGYTPEGSHLFRLYRGGKPVKVFVGNSYETLLKAVRKEIRATR